MMKLNLKLILTMACMAWTATACRTTSHSNVEQRTESVERQREAKADSVSEHTADSVFVWVERGDSIVRIIERKVHTRERVKVVRDTVVIYARNDTLVKVEAVRTKTARSPPHRKLYLALGLLTIALAAVIAKNIKTY